MASTNGARKRTTAADIAAAVKVGAIDPDAEVMTPEDVSAMTAAIPAAEAAIAVPLSATEHECGIPGCKHGSSHPAVSQPDRQVKLQCPSCGAVARMTSAAIAKTGGVGVICGGDGSTFAPAARRTYKARS